ncbi:protein hook-like isoform X2 [Columba livia]|uniref:protein hook-like isoform X2 n=1 Tax=Columba livia TaxID=8932 RepID=UPI0031BA3439
MCWTSKSPLFFHLLCLSLHKYTSSHRSDLRGTYSCDSIRRVRPCPLPRDCSAIVPFYMPGQTSSMLLPTEGKRPAHPGFLGQQISEELIPDLNRISENSDPTELGRLLQLILGCAVNCERKQELMLNALLAEESSETHREDHDP